MLSGVNCVGLPSKSSNSHLNTSSLRAAHQPHQRNLSGEHKVSFKWKIENDTFEQRDQTLNAIATDLMSFIGKTDITFVRNTIK